MHIMNDGVVRPRTAGETIMRYVVGIVETESLDRPHADPPR
jgi:hypothetical protein